MIRDLIIGNARVIAEYLSGDIGDSSQGCLIPGDVAACFGHVVIFPLLRGLVMSCDSCSSHVDILF